MKLALAILSLMTVSSSAFADGAPIMTCSGPMGNGSVNVAVDRTVTSAGFVDTLVATTQNGQASDVIANEVVDFQASTMMDRVYVGATAKLDLKYINESDVDQFGANVRYYNATLTVSSQSAQSYAMTCSLTDIQ